MGKSKTGEGRRHPGRFSRGSIYVASEEAPPPKRQVPLNWGRFARVKNKKTLGHADGKNPSQSIRQVPIFFLASAEKTHPIRRASELQFVANTPFGRKNKPVAVGPRRTVLAGGSAQDFQTTIEQHGFVLMISGPVFVDCKSSRHSVRESFSSTDQRVLSSMAVAARSGGCWGPNCGSFKSEASTLRHKRMFMLHGH